MELNRIYNENCIETMKRMPDDFVDLVVTSPPYDELRDYHGCSWNFDIFQLVANELFRVVKPGGVVVWVVNDSTIDGSETVTSAKQKIHFHEIGFKIHDTMIYEKNGASYPSKDKYYQVFEYMFVFSKGKPKTYNPIKDRVNRWAGQKWSKKRTRRTKNGDLVQQDWYIEQDNPTGVRFNIWKYNNGAGYSSEEEFAHEHPAIFPEQLAADHIHSWSNKNDLVYDPFGGSGTVAKKAIQMKRNWIISEIALEYVSIAEKRIAPHLQQLNLAI